MQEYKCTVCHKVKPENEFYKQNKKTGNKKVRHDCKECHSKWKKNYFATETGFMTKLYSSMKDRSTLNNRINRYIAHSVELTLEEFIQEWENHKTKYGMTCCYTGVKLDFIKKKGRGTQVSVDRLDNSIGYTKDNIVFCSARANFEKHSVSIDMCRKILVLYEERQGLTKTIK